MEQLIIALQTPDCDWLLQRFIEVNFSKLTDSNQIFRNYFVGLHYHLCKVSSQIIKCVIFAPCELSITIYSIVLDRVIVQVSRTNKIPTRASIKYLVWNGIILPYPFDRLLHDKRKSQHVLNNIKI